MIAEQRARCLQCKSTMRKTTRGRGYLGHGVFCTLTCGYRFAMSIVREAATQS